MPALNYQKRFAELVISGAKTHTIRAKRKHAIKPGAVLFHYVGMRSKACKRIALDVCTAVRDVVITEGRLYIGGQLIDGNARDIIAKVDGFKDWAEMHDWFVKTHGTPFYGDIIYWNPVNRNANRIRTN